MAANEWGKIFALCLPLTLPAYANGTAKSGEAFFRWLDSDISNATAVWRTLNSPASPETRLLQNRPVSKPMANSSQADFPIPRGDGGITSWRMRY